MPRRSLLSDTERDSLLVLPQSQDDLIQQYSFTDADLALIRQRRRRLAGIRRAGEDAQRTPARAARLPGTVSLRPAGLPQASGQPGRPRYADRQGDGPRRAFP
ncbi:MAG: DUF4158 domain-containing protein [Pseudoxanthomonas sp.]|nr:DUF4158 domain-containing protein [Pseudoxanthomonas sp.]